MKRIAPRTWRCRSGLPFALAFTFALAGCDLSPQPLPPAGGDNLSPTSGGSQGGPGLETPSDAALGTNSESGSSRGGTSDAGSVALVVVDASVDGSSAGLDGGSHVAGDAGGDGPASASDGSGNPADAAVDGAQEAMDGMDDATDGEVDGW